MKIIIVMTVSWNLLIFAMFGLDKRQAIKGRQRISEKTLLLASFFMGGLGGLLGMHVFRHKTKHLKFKLLLPLALTLNVALAYLAWSRVFSK